MVSRYAAAEVRICPGTFLWSISCSCVCFVTSWSCYLLMFRIYYEQYPCVCVCVCMISYKDTHFGCLESTSIAFWINWYLYCLYILCAFQEPTIRRYTAKWREDGPQPHWPLWGCLLAVASFRCWRWWWLVAVSCSDFVFGQRKCMTLFSLCLQVENLVLFGLIHACAANTIKGLLLAFGVVMSELTLYARVFVK
jgi:hypothetical protein